jgi:hypothetical protein
LQEIVEDKKEGILPVATAATISTATATPSSAVPSATATPSTTVATTSATTSAAMSTTSATPPAFMLRARLIHDECAAKKILTVETCDSLFRFCIIFNFRETEAPRLPCKAIAKQCKLIRLHPDFRKQRRHLLFCSLERQISHIQFLQGRSPCASMCGRHFIRG